MSLRPEHTAKMADEIDEETGPRMVIQHLFIKRKGSRDEKRIELMSQG